MRDGGRWGGSGVDGWMAVAAGWPVRWGRCRETYALVQREGAGRVRGRQTGSQVGRQAGTHCNCNFRGSLTRPHHTHSERPIDTDDTDMLTRADEGKNEWSDSDHTHAHAQDENNTHTHTHTHTHTYTHVHVHVHALCQIKRTNATHPCRSDRGKRAPYERVQTQ
mmetsp:Transcript_50380/g.126200  ORF Transcript_50380/g.126200 Transcript_50380/m.126200 type:complete len:165 (+) Transcript_50380:356-850(+)